MVSQTFSLGEEGSKGICSKILVVIVVGAVVAAVVVAAIFGFRTSQQNSGCESPKLDPNGLSNYTSGAKKIVFSCFPGFFVDESSGESSNMLVSECKDDQWVPEPPTCNYLPLRLDCEVRAHGLIGNVSMMQIGLSDPTTIVGMVDYSGALKSQGHINERIHLTRLDPSCVESKNYNLTDEIRALNQKRNETNEHIIKIFFQSDNLAAYKRAEVWIQMIYLDFTNIAAIISAHQGNVSLVMQKGELSDKDVAWAQSLSQSIHASVIKPKVDMRKPDVVERRSSFFEPLHDDAPNVVFKAR